LDEVRHVLRTTMPADSRRRGATREERCAAPANRCSSTESHASIRVSPREGSPERTTARSEQIARASIADPAAGARTAHVAGRRQPRAPAVETTQGASRVSPLPLHQVVRERVSPWPSHQVVREWGHYFAASVVSPLMSRKPSSFLNVL